MTRYSSLSAGWILDWDFFAKGGLPNEARPSERVDLNANEYVSSWSSVAVSGRDRAVQGSPWSSAIGGRSQAGVGALIESGEKGAVRVL